MALKSIINSSAQLGKLTTGLLDKAKVGIPCIPIAFKISFPRKPVDPANKFTFLTIYLTTFVNK